MSFVSYLFQPGDLLACYGSDFASRGISLATSSVFAPRGLRWSPSHVGVIVEEPSLGSVFVESTTFCEHPCLVAERKVSGLQAQNPLIRVNDYTARRGRVSILRLTRGNALTLNESQWLTSNCLSWINDSAPYDLIGAALSGTRVYQSLRLFPSADMSSLFCSEFVAYLLQSLCRMNRSNPSRYNPGRLIRELVKTGVYMVHHEFKGVDRG